MEGNLTLDSEGRPFRMLVFRGSPKSSRKSIRYVDEIRRSNEDNFKNKLTNKEITQGSGKAILNHDVRVRNSLVLRLKAHRSKVCGLKWSITGNLLASGGDDNVVHMGGFKDELSAVRVPVHEPCGGSQGLITLKCWPLVATPMTGA